jgi:hypothetical protein
LLPLFPDVVPPDVGDEGVIVDVCDALFVEEGGEDDFGEVVGEIGEAEDDFGDVLELGEEEVGVEVVGVEDVGDVEDEEDGALVLVVVVVELGGDCAAALRLVMDIR